MFRTRNKEGYYDAAVASLNRDPAEDEYASLYTLIDDYLDAQNVGIDPYRKIRDDQPPQVTPYFMCGKNSMVERRVEITRDEHGKVILTVGESSTKEDPEKEDERQVPEDILCENFNPVGLPDEPEISIPEDMQIESLTFMYTSNDPVIPTHISRMNTYTKITAHKAMIGISMRDGYICFPYNQLETYTDCNQGEMLLAIWNAEKNIWMIGDSNTQDTDRRDKYRQQAATILSGQEIRYDFFPDEFQIDTASTDFCDVGFFCCDTYVDSDVEDDRCYQDLDDFCPSLPLSDSNIKIVKKLFKNIDLYEDISSKVPSRYDFRQRATFMYMQLKGFEGDIDDNAWADYDISEGDEVIFKNYQDGGYHILFDDDKPHCAYLPVTRNLCPDDGMCNKDMLHFSDEYHILQKGPDEKRPLYPAPPLTRYTRMRIRSQNFYRDIKYYIREHPILRRYKVPRTTVLNLKGRFIEVNPCNRERDLSFTPSFFDSYEQYLGRKRNKFRFIRETLIRRMFLLGEPQPLRVLAKTLCVRSEVIITHLQHLHLQGLVDRSVLNDSWNFKINPKEYGWCLVKKHPWQSKVNFSSTKSWH